MLLSYIPIENVWKPETFWRFFLMGGIEMEQPIALWLFEDAIITFFRTVRKMVNVLNVQHLH